MTYDMQITARNMANYYRNLVATGWARDKNGYAPTAKSMNALLVIGDATKLGCSVKTCLREGFSVVVCEFDG
ncbi:hypothetical protein ANCCEY_09855 [Ancylostoma ceylanicum]|uniref:SCP domain-containing protein n=1 Tax=Ancylostoma ceylanicum TaxID=53326 RepID=A0A0D6LIM4_9BILA|nr:hypothetical protein ANCCEY_09855 [Ancylostoma ceylanicum]